MLGFYAEHFTTVEINSTFYRLPRERTIKRWKELVGDPFVFSVKASRFITHRLKLKGANEPLERFYSSVKGLGRKLGVILFQTPPTLKRDDGLLESFLGLLDPRRRHVMEFRDESWFDPDVIGLLRRYRVAFCAQSHPRLPDTLERTSNVVYVRFHGVPKLYTSDYSEAALARWADRIAEAAGRSATVYCYFNNDVEGHAVRNALRLRAMLHGRVENRVEKK